MNTADFGQETILVAEDEPLVRNLIVRILVRGGYRVLEADSAAEALTLSNSYEGAIDLFITDHGLKTMTGKEVAEEIRRSRGGLKVLHISGHSFDQVKREGGIVAGSGFLAKPFLAKGLIEKVKEMLRNIYLAAT